ncbi:putative amidohydrolase [Leucobacter luti]|uniref:carbon-nitrogen hydrolase family protein n=1 Tax=Leucobacter luti TaxID=340320 RepID=UPI0010CE0B2B|nr:carbon-nitrogen hydrolase family protein [Leucobacter luti]MCW2286971.1 putative amidohydrolase [Leucobacter luti]TCK41198.1 putative amidohydrolase [Leucobacter luti]
MSTTSLRYCLVQHEPVTSLDAFEHELAALVAEHPGVQLFVFPEMHVCGGEADGALAGLTHFIEPLDGPRDQRFRAAAQRHGIWLIPGSVYEATPGPDIQDAAAATLHTGEATAFNTVSAYSPSGERVASYRKVFPWQPYEQSTPGSEFTVFQLGEFGRVGLSICYDIWFPEHARQLAWLGADLLVNVVRTGTNDREQELVLCRATAIANQLSVLSVNAASPGSRGQSIAVDAEGRPRVRAVDASPQELVDTIDLADSRRVRRTGTAGVNRVWEQLDHSPIALPMYWGGVIQPSPIARDA